MDDRKQILINLISEKKQELIFKQNRYLYNSFAGVCKTSLVSQKKEIFYLELEIDKLEFKLEHNLFDSISL